MLIMKHGRRQIAERRKLANQERIRKLVEKNDYKYLGILEADTIKQEEMEKKEKKIISPTNKNFPET